MCKASSLRTPAASIKVTMSGVTAERIRRIKVITSRQTATLIRITGTAKMEIMVT
jgi:hypothetical protein